MSRGFIELVKDYPKYCHICVQYSFIFSSHSNSTFDEMALADGYIIVNTSAGVERKGICRSCNENQQITLLGQKTSVIWYDSKEHAENIKNGVS